MAPAPPLVAHEKRLDANPNRRVLMRRSFIALARFLQLPMRRQCLYAEAMGRLVGAWLLVRAVPFKHWRAQLKQSAKTMATSEVGMVELDFLRSAQHVFGQIKWASRDRATCLMMVLVARWMLNRRRIPGTIYLGVRRKSESGALHAHAWMLSTIGVVGHENVDGFAIVERFDA